MFKLLTRSFSSIFSHLTGNAALTEKNIKESLQKIRESLLEADVPLSVIDTFLADISLEVSGQKVLSSLKPAEQFIKIVYDRLVQLLGGASTNDFEVKFPAIIMMMGLQGSGKTTSIAKLCYYLKKKKKSLSLLTASVDFYRPAAIDQLEVLTRKANVDFFRSTKTDVVDAAQEISAYARSHKYDVLLLDTAGRLHVDKNMLQELVVLNDSMKPSHKLLVLDAMTGQESLNVARTFNDAVGFDYALLSKMDSDARGGAAFAFAYSLQKSIAFIGTGEKLEDLQLFKPERIASRMLSMGDIQTLLEKAEEKIKKSDQVSIEKAFNSGKFTLADFAKQLEMVNKMGSLSSMMQYLPGVSTSLSPSMVEQGEKELKRFKAIIGSMTIQEQIYPKILNGSRKKRIATGAGVTPAQVNQLLDRFEKSQQFVKLFKKYGRMPGF